MFVMNRMAVARQQGAHLLLQLFPAVLVEEFGAAGQGGIMGDSMGRIGGEPGCGLSRRLLARDRFQGATVPILSAQGRLVHLDGIDTSNACRAVRP